jgi:hypothetical protein
MIFRRTVRQRRTWAARRAQDENRPSLLFLLEHVIGPGLGPVVHEQPSGNESALYRRRRDVLRRFWARTQQDENGSAINVLLFAETIPPGLGPVVHEEPNLLPVRARHWRNRRRSYVARTSQDENAAPWMNLLAVHIIGPGLGPVVQEQEQGFEAARWRWQWHREHSRWAREASQENRTDIQILLEEPPPPAPVEGRSRALYAGARAARR